MITRIHGIPTRRFPFPFLRGQSKDFGYSFFRGGLFAHSVFEGVPFRLETFVPSSHSPYHLHQRFAYSSSGVSQSPIVLSQAMAMIRPEKRHHIFGGQVQTKCSPSLERLHGLVCGRPLFRPILNLLAFTFSQRGSL